MANLNLQLKAQKMKVESVTTFSGEYIVIDGEDYQRFGPNCWEKRYGDSWESESYKEKELEAAYQEWKLG